MRTAFIRFRVVALAALLTLSMFSSTWAAGEETRLQRSLETVRLRMPGRNSTGGTMRPPPKVASMDREGRERVNVLLLGIDERTSQHGPWRADTIIVLTVDPATREAGMLSIPRDLWVSIPGIGDNRINTAHFFGDLRSRPDGGPALIKKTTQQNFAIPIHHYVRINFVGFEKVIDTIGGVDIDVSTGIGVPEDANRPRLPDGDVAYDPLHIPAGHHHMDGKLALKYARTRLGDSDFHRMKRQQQVIMAARDRVMQLGLFRLLLRLPQLVDSMADAIQTDIPVRELLALGRLARQIDRDHIEARTIDQSMTVPVTTLGGEQVLRPDWDEICPLVDELFGSPRSPPSAAGQACGRKAVGCCGRSRR